MNFAHDTKRALLAVVALVNTRAEASDSGDDEMTSPAQFQAFIDAHGYNAVTTSDPAELVKVRTARTPLGELWDVDTERAVDLVNGLLRKYDALPQLVRHDGWDWHVHAVSAGAPLADRICVETALAVVDLIRGEELRRLRRCEGDGCGAVLVDFSRNRSKRYCDVGNCANRAHVAAYRERQSAT